MSTPELKQCFTTPDGQVFDTKAEAMDHLRQPKIKEALMSLTDNNEDLCDWLIENMDTVTDAFDTGSIKRVTKNEKKLLIKSLEAVIADGNPAFKFIIENSEAIVDSFRWPTVKRMTDEEKAVAAKNSMVAASDGNEELADWVLENKDAVLEAFDAGKVKRQVSEKAKKALEEYRAKQAAEKEKAAKEA